MSSPAKDLVQDQKAYGTRCSQAVPHPSTILARRCLTAVIGREQVCSSWCGRRQSTNLFGETPSSSSFSLHTTSLTTTRSDAPRNNNAMAQINNIKLPIVTDIKVSADSSFVAFRISAWVGHFNFQKKRRTQNCTIMFSHLMKKNRTGRTSFLQHVIKANRTKSLRHQVFPGGPPSKYYPGPTMLNCCDRTRTGVFIVVWP